MSTYWGYVCMDHDPPLRSEEWFNRGDKKLAAYLKAVRAGGYAEVDSLPLIEYVDGYPTKSPGAWLMDHPKCWIALGNEYGEIVEVPE